MRQAQGHTWVKPLVYGCKLYTYVCESAPVARRARPASELHGPRPGVTLRRRCRGRGRAGLDRSCARSARGRGRDLHLGAALWGRARLTAYISYFHTQTQKRVARLRTLRCSVLRARRPSLDAAPRGSLCPERQRSRSPGLQHTRRPSCLVPRMPRKRAASVPHNTRHAPTPAPPGNIGHPRWRGPRPRRPIPPPMARQAALGLTGGIAGAGPRRRPRDSPPRQGATRSGRGDPRVRPRRRPACPAPALGPACPAPALAPSLPGACPAYPAYPAPALACLACPASVPAACKQGADG